MEFPKVGDTIEVLKDHCNLYRKGAIGTVLELDVDNWLLVQFLSREFSKVKKALGATAKGQWWVNPNEVKVVKESSMKEGYGLDISKKNKAAYTGWAVEVDGEINPWDVFSTRKEARKERNYIATSEYVNKASVRRVEIKVLEHKV